MATAAAELTKPYSYVRNLKQGNTPMAEPHHASSIDWGQIAAYGVGLLGLKEALPKLWGWLAKVFETENARRIKHEENADRQKRRDNEALIALYDRIIADNQNTITQLRHQVNELLLIVGNNSEQIEIVRQIAQQATNKANASMAINNPEVIERVVRQAQEPTNGQA